MDVWTRINKKKTLIEYFCDSFLSLTSYSILREQWDCGGGGKEKDALVDGIRKLLLTAYTLKDLLPASWVAGKLWKDRKYTSNLVFKRSWDLDHQLAVHLWDTNLPSLTLTSGWKQPVYQCSLKQMLIPPNHPVHLSWSDEEWRLSAPADLQGKRKGSREVWNHCPESSISKGFW